MGPVRLVPPWTELRSQLHAKLETQKGFAPEVTEGVKLSDRPSILFRESCCPNLMPLVCFYSSSSTSCFASFTWRGAKGSKSKVRLWIYSAEAETPVTQADYALEGDPEVLLLTHVASQNLFVAYCNDLHLRLFGDHTQGLRLLSDKLSPYSITSMCYNPVMCELVTGAIGMLTFWTFGMQEVPSLSIIQTVSILSGEFVHFLSVERECKALVALCENMILVFDYHSKVKMQTFQVNQGVSLTCCAVNWLQSSLYAGDLAGDVKVWNFDTGSQTDQFKAHLSAVVSVVSRVSVHTLMTASLDGLMKEWDLTTCELLRRVDIGEHVFQMQFISEQTFFLRTQYTFSIRAVNNFYQLFSRPNSILKKLVRMQCGPEKARLLASTEDGVIHFLSPVTGEILFVTWPFKQVEKALDYVYDPDREELLVTMGTADIYAMDTTRNPCPCKYILRATDSRDDKVLCLAYSRLDLGGRTSSFIFSGYKSGRVHSVTRHVYRMGSRRIHDGNVLALSSLSASGNHSCQSRESSFLCSYGSDEYIILSDVVLRKSTTILDVEPLVCIPSIHYRINHLLLIPGYICVLTEQNRVRLWRQATLVPGKKNPFWKETGAMHSSSITSFDYCHRLGMLVTAGSDGSVRLWDILGHLLVEFDTSLRFSRVCFANQRGDLVVGCNKNIYFISCVAYLPRRHISKLAAQHVTDDVIERPLPFLPNFLLRFDTVFVPKYNQMVKNAMEYERLEPISNPKEVWLAKGLVWVAERASMDVCTLPLPDFYGLPPATKGALLGFGSKQKLMQQPPFWHTPEKRSLPTEGPLPQPYRGLPALHESVPLLQRITLQAGHSWPIAPDGYVPNSVIRALLFPKGTPSTLQCSLLMTRKPLPQRQLVRIPWKEISTSEYALLEKVRKKKVQRPRLVQAIPERQRDLLADIVSKPWLRHKPSEMTLPSVIKAILELLDDVPFSTYLMCTAALVQLAESYPLPPEIQEQAFERLIQDTVHKEVRMRVAAWETLGKMDLLDGKDVVPLAKALLDENQQVRDLARSLLDSVAGITDKFVLKKEVRRLAKCSLEDVILAGQSSDLQFPHRLRVAGVIAGSPDEAVDALIDVSQKLVNRMEKQLTANLFLVADKFTEDSQDQDVPSWRRWGPAATEEVAEEAESEAPVEAKARWLGLFDTAEKKPAGAIAIEAARRRMAEKAPKSPSAAKSRAPAVTVSAELLSESSARSSTSTSSTSSSTWQEVRRQKKQLKAPRDQQGAKPASSLSQEAPKPPKLTQPIPLQRRDTRMQLYTEMLKRQHTTRKKEHPGAPSLAPKPEGTTAPRRPSRSVSPVPPQEASRGSLIDPNKVYSTDKSKWRSDLYKLLMLRIGPAVEGCTAMEDLMASARVALGGRHLSWELLANIGQSLLAAQEETAAQPAKLMQYMAELFKTSPWELWPEAAVESNERIVAVKMGREIRRTSEMGSSSSSSSGGSGGSGGSLEDMPRIQGEEAAAAAESAQEPSATLAEKKLKTAVKRRWKKASTLTSQERKAAGEKEKAEEDEKAKEEQKEKVGKTVSGEGWEAVRRRARGLMRGREREEGPAMEKAREPPKGKAQELATEKEQEAGKQRGEREAEERKERRGSRRAAARWTRRRGGGTREEGPALEGKQQQQQEEEEAALTEAARMMLSGGVARALTKSQDAAMSKLQERILAEAQEMALAELREQAEAEARKRVLAELREQAEAEARKSVLDELREKALAEARERVMLEAKESTLAEIRHRLLGEERARALAEAQRVALAEGLEGEQAEARVTQLCEDRLRELTEAKLRELANEWLKKVETKPTMAKVLELAEASVSKVTEAQIAELTEVKLAELAKEEEEAQRQVKLEELAEARIWELAGKWIQDRAKTRALELAETKLRELAMRKLAQRADRTLEREEAEMWEATGEEEDMLFSEEERGALLVALQEERAQRPELSHSAHARLLLDVLTKPERLVGSDSKLFLQLFQVVSLLKIPSGLSCKELAEFLIYKADQIATAGEEEDKRLAKEVSPVYVELRKVVEVLESPVPDMKEFAAKIQSLLRVAQAMLRARALKEQLERGFPEHTWWKKAVKEWLEDEGRGVGRRAWMDQKMREAIKKWQAEQKRAEEEDVKDRHFTFIPRPFKLGKGTWQERRQQKPGQRGEEETRRPEAVGQPAWWQEQEQQQPQSAVWFLNERSHRTREALFKLAEPSPREMERYEAPPRQHRKQLPKGSLYLPTKLPQICPPKIRRGMNQQPLRLPKKAVDWETFSVLYQSLLTLKEQEGGVESAAWHELLCKLLDLYGLKNPSVRALVQQLLTGDHRPRKAIPGKDVPVREVEANLGERILCHVAPHAAGLLPSPPTLHGVIPLSYQNNVHPFELVGITRFGTLCLKWKTSSWKGKLLTVCLDDHAQAHPK